MQTFAELEKVETQPLVRKKFSTHETHKMVEVGILPEESGWELIDGEIIRRMTIGSKHAGVVNSLNQLLVIFFGKSVLVSVQNPIQIDDYNEPEPDIAILKPRKDFYQEKLPTPEDILLIIEVSDSTIQYDRDVKKTLYAKSEIPEFWLVNLKNETVECYSSPKNGNYHLAQIFEKGETITSKTLENLTVEVEEILA